MGRGGGWRMHGLRRCFSRATSVRRPKATEVATGRARLARAMGLKRPLVDGTEVLINPWPARSRDLRDAHHESARDYAALSHSPNASNEASRPRNPCTSVAAGAPPPGSRIDRRYRLAGAGLRSPSRRNTPKRSLAITSDHMYV